MNFKKRIEELNTNLVLQETKIDFVISELRAFAIKIDSESLCKFRLLINDLMHFKNEYNSILTQLNTYTVYEARS